MLRGRAIEPPVRFHPGVEQADPHESATIARLNEALDIILERTSRDYGRAVRAVHAKAHGLIEGTLQIDDGLPPELRQGLFAEPGEHRVCIRLSTNAGDILPDTVSLPRGFALKVFDVEGERLPDAEGTAQDFIMVAGRAFQARDADAFLENLTLLARTTDRAEGLKVAASSVLRGVNAALAAVGLHPTELGSLGGAPNSDPLGETYNSLTPFRYGDHIAKFEVRPLSKAMQAMADESVHPDAEHPDAIRDAVCAAMAKLDGEWEFRVQLCRNLAEQPIEDCTAEWDEAGAPFQRVGVIRAPAQNAWSAERVHAIDEGMRFSVWTGLAAHRPLGNINRARKLTYRHSADFRAAFNRCPIHEPIAG